MFSQKLEHKDILHIYDQIFSSSVGKYQTYSFNSDEPIEIRNLSAKVGFNFNEWGNSLEDDLVFFNMLKEGMLSIQFAWFARDCNTKPKKELFKFLDRYSIKSANFHGSDIGKSKYEIDAIVKNEYTLFLELIWNVINAPENIGGDYEEVYMDFFEMIVTLNFKNFFEKTNRKFVARKDYSVREVDNIKNYLFELLNDGDDVIQISLFDYIKKYSAVYPILLSLERRGKLELLNVKIDWDRTVSEIYWKRWPKVIFEINPLVNEFLPEFHIDTEGLFLADEQDIHVCDFREGNLVIGTDIYTFTKDTKLESLVRLIFDARQKHGKNITLNELSCIYKINPSLYPHISESTFIYASIRDIIKSKYENIQEKSKLKALFFGLTKNGITMPF